MPSGTVHGTAFPSTAEAIWAAGGRSIVMVGVVVLVIPPVGVPKHTLPELVRRVNGEISASWGTARCDARTLPAGRRGRAGAPGAVGGQSRTSRPRTPRRCSAASPGRVRVDAAVTALHASRRVGSRPIRTDLGADARTWVHLIRQRGNASIFAQHPLERPTRAAGNTRRARGSGASGRRGQTFAGFACLGLRAAARPASWAPAQTPARR